MLKESEFDLLVFLEANQMQVFTQRALSSKLGLSLGLVNKNLRSLLDLDLIATENKGQQILTKKAYEFLQPYKVERAIFLAAGFVKDFCQ